MRLATCGGLIQVVRLAGRRRAHRDPDDRECRDWRLLAGAGGEHDGPGLMPCTGLALPLWVVLGQAPVAEMVICPASILPG